MEVIWEQWWPLVKTCTRQATFSSGGMCRFPKILLLLELCALLNPFSVVDPGGSQEAADSNPRRRMLPGSDSDRLLATSCSQSPQDATTSV